MKKFIVCSTILSLIAIYSFGQDAPEKKGFDKSRLFIGGNLGLSFSSYSTSINITPQVGYFFSQHFAAGVGLNYALYKYNIYNYNNVVVQKQTYSYAGINIFGRVYPIRQAFVQVQPELNYVWGTLTNVGYPDSKVSQFVPSMLLGAGAAIPAGRGSMVLSVMYDVLQNNLSPYYHHAIYGFGYNIGF